MNWQELKSEIRDLGFEDEQTMVSYSEILLNACNRAIRLISTTVRPVTGHLDIDHPGGLVRYSLTELAQAQGDTFESLYGTPIERDTYRPCSYYLENRKVFVLDDEPGLYRLWYRKRPETLTLDTPETFVLELDLDVQPLLPLLASHYLWLDDDERKATLYWNEYDDLKGQILANSQESLRGVVKGGVSWLS
jgi:hypothetical protein